MQFPNSIFPLDIGYNYICVTFCDLLLLLYRYLTGQVDKRTLEKYEREAREKNRESWYVCVCEKYYKQNDRFYYENTKKALLCLFIGDKACDVIGT